MNNDQIHQRIREVVQKIGDNFKPEKIILFGSYAWGNPGPDSDVDLFIIKDMPDQRIDRSRKVRKIIWGSGIPIDVLVYTPIELEEQINIKHNFFLEDIIRNGIVLYSKQGGREISIAPIQPFTIIP